MYKSCVTIKNEVGLHARPASIFVMKAKEFQSDVTIARVGEESKFNAKSLMKLIILAAKKDEVVEICAEGQDEEQAVKALVSLVENGLEE